MLILKTTKKNLNEIARITAKAIKQGRVVICPTDTVYGLVAAATNKKAVERIFKIKKRPKTHPLPVFVKDIKTAKKLAKIGKKDEKFLKKNWPGKVTVVLSRKKTKTKLYGLFNKTIALRIPKYKLVNDLLKKTNLPLTGTSANISGKPTSTKIQDILNQFTLRRGSGQKNKPDLIIDAGNLKKSKPSTIIDLTAPKHKILRK
jgi:L-threonylcarbamoyladenylate synthase